MIVQILQFSAVKVYTSILYAIFSGCKQSGVHLNDAVLPPWARDDPREFIRAHREVS